MKLYRIFLLPAITLAASLSTSATAAPEVNDTIMSINNASNVVISETADGVTLQVNGTKTDPDFSTTFSAPYTPNATVKISQRFSSPFLPKAKNVVENRDAVQFLDGLHAGFVTMLGAPQGMDVEMGKSFEIGIDQIIGYKVTSHKQPGGLSVGLGINWRNYRMTANTRFLINPDGYVTTAPFPEGTTGCYSRLKVFSLEVPVTYQFYTRIRAIAGTHMTFTIGAILNWNSHSSLQSAWTDDTSNQRIKQTIRDFGQRKFTVDLIATWKVAPQIGLYCRYSPMKLFKAEAGPSVTSLSTGLYIGF